MEITLTPGLEDWIEGRIKSGLYESKSEVIREAIRRMMLETDDLDWNPDDLWAAVAEAQQAVDEGRVVRADAAFTALLARNQKPQ
jgi:putative addiction module CopG family antidote